MICKHFFPRFCTLIVVVAFSAIGATLQIQSFKFSDKETDEIIYCIQDMPLNYHAKLFANTPEDAKRLKCYPKDEVRSSVNVFLIYKNKKYTLVDCGLGDKNSALLPALNQLGILPSQISNVVLTHFHNDHVAGLISTRNQQVFPNAAIWISSPEYTSSIRKGGTFFRRFQMVCRRNLKLFQNDAEIVPGLKAYVDGGHTPGHTMFVLNDKVVFIGSTIMALQWQLSEPDLYARDIEENPANASRVRRQLYEMCASKQMIVAGAHLPFPGVGCIDKNDKDEYFFKAYSEK